MCGEHFRRPFRVCLYWYWHWSTHAIVLLAGVAKVEELVVREHRVEGKVQKSLRRFRQKMVGRIYDSEVER